jgi:hypothetical protein
MFQRLQATVQHGFCRGDDLGRIGRLVGGTIFLVSVELDAQAIPVDCAARGVPDSNSLPEGITSSGCGLHNRALIGQGGFGAPEDCYCAEPVVRAARQADQRFFDEEYIGLT